jgi:6-phosphogluconolactonase
MIVKNFNSSAELYHKLAKDIMDTLSINSKSCSMILSGGHSPVSIHKLLVEQTSGLKNHWENISFFFSDERCVPPDDELSNYALAKETLFEPLGLSENNVYRIKGEDPPQEAAKMYHNQVSAFLNQHHCFDLALLGMGPDSHTASLFPQSAALEVKDRFATAAGPGPEGRQRVTLTYKALNASKQIMVMVTGKNKIKALEKALRQEADYRDYPIKGLNPLEKLIFYCAP